MYTALTALVTKVKPLPKSAIPQCWITWLQNLRKHPSVLLTDLEDPEEGDDPVNMREDDIKIVEQLQRMIQNVVESNQQERLEQPKETWQLSTNFWIISGS